MKGGSLEGDFSRILFEPRKHYSGVQMQQGRVQLDSDWNAQLDVLTYGIDTALRDAFGAHGGPEGHAGFAIEPVSTLSFDGGGQYVEVGPTRDFAFPGATPFALEVQVSPQAEGVGGTVLSRLTGGREAAGYRLSVRRDRRVAFVRSGGLDDADGPGGSLRSERELVSGEPIPADTFTRVGVVFDGREVSIHLDGRLAARGASPAHLPATDAPLLFGAAAGAWEPGGFFDGELAEVRIRAWPGGSGGSGPHGSDPLGWWPLDEGHGDVVADRAGSHPGVLRGGVEGRWRLRDLRIGAGRYYVCGVLCENDRPVLFTSQPDYPGAELPSGDGRFLVYLDVWQRTITWIQDPSIREIALGGPDTTVRSQTVAQVRQRPLTRDDDGSALAPGPPAGRMQARWTPVGSLGNYLYRIEIHDAGWLGVPDLPGTPTFKWSRRNGSVVLPIESIRRKKGEIYLQPGTQVHEILRVGDWIEILDDKAVLLNEAHSLVQIESIDPDIPRITVAPPPPIGVGTDPALQPFLRVWDQEGDERRGGTIPIQAGVWMPVEAGIEVRFEPGAFFNTGTFWWIPARTLLPGGIEWPQHGDEPAAEPPVGIHHCGCPLAVLEIGPRGIRLRDRRQTFPPLTRAGGGEPFPPGLAVLSESPVPPRGWAATGHYLVAPSLHPGWSQRDFAFPEVCWLAGAVVDEQIYLVSESAVWRWDPARPDEPPVPQARLPEPRRDFGLAACRGRLYVVGGFSLQTGEPLGRNDQYDPRTGSWCSRTPLPIPRGALALAELDGLLHAVGGREQGRDEEIVLDLHDVYHPGEDAWRQGIAPPQPVAGAGAATFRDRIVLAGGRGPDGLLDRVEVFHPGSGWQATPPLPRAVAAPAAAALQGVLWVLGGRDGRGWSSTAVTWDPAAQSWADKPPLPTPPRLPVAAALRDQLHVLSPLGAEGGGRLAIQTWQGPAVLYVLRKENEP